MLKIAYGTSNDIYWNIDMEFEILFDLSWLQNDLNKKILRDIDNCTFNSNLLVDINSGDPFPVFNMSTGSKLLILANMSVEPISFWGPHVGDNCTDILLQIANNKDITLYMKHLLNFDRSKFKAFSTLLGRDYVDYDEYIKELLVEATKW